MEVGIALLDRVITGLLDTSKVFIQYFWVKHDLWTLYEGAAELSYCPIRQGVLSVSVFVALQLVLLFVKV